MHAFSYYSNLSAFLYFVQNNLMNKNLFFHAFNFHYDELIEFLIKQYPQFAGKSSYDVYTIQHCIKHNFWLSFQATVENGADLNVVDRKGKTLLEMARKHKVDHRIIDYLIKH